LLSLRAAPRFVDIAGIFLVFLCQKGGADLTTENSRVPPHASSADAATDGSQTTYSAGRAGALDRRGDITACERPDVRNSSIDEYRLNR
jgi:hypothetical protein